MDALDYLDPLTHFTPDEYVSFWSALFQTILQGVWARVLATTFLVMSFWYGVRRQQFFVGLWFFVLAFAITYGVWVLGLMGVVTNG